MDAGDITQIFDNDEGLYDEINDRTIELLQEHGFNRQNPADSQEQPSTYYRLIGDAVQDIINEVTENLRNQPTLAGMLLGTALREVDWYEVGKHYYQDNAERLTTP